ncbi:MAG: J domain-containing protein, partial [Chloroflexota bacterium]|nr:J domain-containing protein [Chloroflexota bacterium]
LEMDDHATPRDNLRVLYLAIEDMRMIEKRGLKKVMRQAYGQLPPPKTNIAVMSPYNVLGVQPDAPMEVVEAVYRAKAKTVHPDVPGGSAEVMQQLNEAIAAIRRERGAA